MKYYLFVIILITFINFIFKFSKSSKKDIVFLVISFLILFLLSALRSEDIGTDLIRYMTRYNYCGSHSLTSFDKSFFSEYGFVIYNKIIYLLSNGNFRTFLVVTSFFSLIGVFYFIYKNSNNYYLSVLFYYCMGFYFFTYSGLKQSIAISLVLIAFSYIQKQKSKKFILFVLIASSFHISALINLPAYVISKVKFKKVFIPIYMLLLIIAYLSRFSIISFITNYLYSDYEVLTNFGKGYSYFFILLFIFCFMTFFKERIINDNGDNNMWYNFFSIGLLFQILATVEGNAHRLTFYYLIPISVLIPHLNSIFNKNDKKAIFLFNASLVSILILYFIVFAKYKTYSFM